MTLLYETADNVADSVGLLISILVRYPEIGTVNFDPQTHGLKLTFIVSGTFGDKDIKMMTEKLLESINVYYELASINPQTFSIDWQKGDNCLVMALKRDVDTLSLEELSFLIELFGIQFNKSLISENNEEMFEEDVLQHEEIIIHMLENVKKNMPDKRLIAYREEGNVLVFNR